MSSLNFSKSLDRSNNVIKFVKEFKPIEIKEPFKTDVIEFTNTDDFNRYYREHEEEFNNMSTYKLNVKYKIPGYKLSKKGSKAAKAAGDLSKSLTQGVSSKDTSSDKTGSQGCGIQGCELILVKDYHNAPSGSEPVHSQASVSLTIENLRDTILELEQRILNIENYLAKGT